MQRRNAVLCTNPYYFIRSRQTERRIGLIMVVEELPALYKIYTQHIMLSQSYFAGIKHTTTIIRQFDYWDRSLMATQNKFF